MSGFSKQAFNNMLNGRKNIDEHAISAISKTLGVTPNDLFGIEPRHRSA